MFGLPSDPDEETELKLAQNEFELQREKKGKWRGG